MASTPPPGSLSQPIQFPGSTPDPLLSSPDTPLPPFTPGSSRITGGQAGGGGPHHPGLSPSSYKSARSARVLDRLHRRGSASDDEDGMEVEDDKLGGLGSGFSFASATTASTTAAMERSPLPSAPPPSSQRRLAPSLLLSQDSPAPSQPLPSSSLSIVVPPPADRSVAMDLVIEGSGGVEADDDDPLPAGLPSSHEVAALEDKLRELNVEFGLEDEEGDDEHREMAGLREIYGATAPLIPKIKATAGVKTRLAAQASEIASLQRIIDVQGELARKASEEQRDIFDVERDGWKAETQILLSRVQASGSGSSGGQQGSAADKQQQAAGSSSQHKKESGFEQLDAVGPEDYNKLLKQWMDLQADHRKSIAEKTAMSYKMRNYEGQIKALTQELHFLRPVAMSGRRPAQSPTDSSLPKTSPSARTRALPPTISPPQPQSRRQTLGDARSEHLLLAARRLRTLREKNPEIGLITAAHYNYASLQAPDPNAPLELYVDGPSDFDDDEGAKDRTPKGKGRAKGKKAAGGSSMAPPKTPVTASAKGKARRKDDASARTPGGSLGTPGRGFEDLLAAAQSLQHPHHPTSTLRDAFAEPPANLTTPTAAPDSPKRRRVGTASGGNAWVPGVTAVGPAQQQGDGLHASALDLLALASSHDPASPAPSSSARLGGLLGSGSDGDVTSESGRSAAGSASRGLEPAFALRSEAPSLYAPSGAYDQQPVAGPSTTPRNMRPLPDGPSPFLGASSSPRLSQTPSALPQRVKDEFAGLARDLSASQSPPARGPAAPLDNATTAVPAKRVRSPYLKWSPEEDELLARGVAKYGQKWDLVSKAVPTRSYHQCRQRWLRKLGMFDHKSAAVTQAAAASSAGSKFPPAPAVPDSPSRRKAGTSSEGPSTSGSASAESS